MVLKNGKHKLVGLVDLGEHHEAMSKLSGKNILNSLRAKFNTNCTLYF